MSAYSEVTSTSDDSQNELKSMSENETWPNDMSAHVASLLLTPDKLRGSLSRIASNHVDSTGLSDEEDDRCSHVSEEPMSDSEPLDRSPLNNYDNVSGSNDTDQETYELEGSNDSFDCSQPQVGSNLVFKTQETDYKKLMTPNGKSFKCPECEQTGTKNTFVTVDKLDSHRSSHFIMRNASAFSNKAFKCSWPDCDKSFHRQHRLRDHINRHMGVKKCVCEHCSRRFATMADRQQHIRRVHLKTYVGTRTKRSHPRITQKEDTNANVPSELKDQLKRVRQLASQLRNDKNLK